MGSEQKEAPKTETIDLMEALKKSLGLDKEKHEKPEEPSNE